MNMTMVTYYIKYDYRHGNQIDSNLPEEIILGGESWGNDYVVKITGLQKNNGVCIGSGLRFRAYIESMVWVLGGTKEIGARDQSSR